MKKLYWRPQKASRAVMVLLAVFSLLAVWTVEHLLVKAKQDGYREKLAAARLARSAFQVLKTERLRRRLPIDVEVDPMQSGLIGLPMSPVTSNSGIMEAKHTSVNPNFAAVIYQMLVRAGVKKGQFVAVGVSGSFPAINVACYAALREIGARPLIITSASGSQFGANLPSFLWVDMENQLSKAGIFPFRSLAASLGGIQDRAMGMSPEGKQMLHAAIQRNNLTLLKPKNLQDSIEQRMALYREAAGVETIVAYINIGGGTASVGTSLGKHLFKSGLNKVAPRGAGSLDSVMIRFAREGTPILHLVGIEDLAKRHGLPLRPTTMPAVGQGKVFYREEYNNWLAGAALLTIFVGLLTFIRTDWGLRLFQFGHAQKQGNQPPQKMV